VRCVAFSRCLAVCLLCWLRIRAGYVPVRSQCEIQLTGEGPWQLPDGGDDVELLFTPGHTQGCISMLYRPQQVVLSRPSPTHSMFLTRVRSVPRLMCVVSACPLLSVMLEVVA